MNSKHVEPDAEPGTGTEYYTEACMHPEDHPRLSEEIETDGDHLSATQFNLYGRTWQCGGEYWDCVIQDLVTLEAVVRKSHWCHTGELEEAPIKLQFTPDHGYDAFEYDPNNAVQAKNQDDPTDRFLPRHNVPWAMK